MPLYACIAHQINQIAPATNNKSRMNSHVVLSGLCLKSIPNKVIRNRECIEKLSLDRNLLTENSFNMPQFVNLKELSVRNNKIKNIAIFIANLQRKCPNLEVLMFENNLGCPDRFTEKEKTIISKCLKKLRILNGFEVHRQKRHSNCSTDSKISSASE